MGFDLTQILNQRSQQAAAAQKKREIVYKNVDNLIPSEDNFYSTEKTENLKASIRAFGLMQPLVIEKTNEGDKIIAGHCRRKCCLELIEEGLTQFEEVPCIYQEHEEGVTGSLINELLVMQTNTYREKTEWEKMRETVRTEEIIAELRKDMNLKGRTRDYLDAIIGVKGAQAARYKVIYKNLIYELMEEFKTGNIGVSVAYETARLDEDLQKLALAEFMKNGILTQSDIEKVKTQQQIPGQMEFPEREVMNKPVQNITEQDKEMIRVVLHQKMSKNCGRYIRDCDVNMTINILYHEFRYQKIYTEPGKRIVFTEKGAAVERTSYITEFYSFQDIAKAFVKEYGKPKEVKIIPVDEKEEPKAQVMAPCSHVEGFQCNLSEAQRLAEQDGESCDGKKCCWNCEKRNLCGYACNASKKNAENQEETPKTQQIITERCENAAVDYLEPLTEEEIAIIQRYKKAQEGMRASETGVALLKAFTQTLEYGWHSPETYPENPDERVMCIISGTYGKTIIEEAAAVGSYDPDDGGWFFPEFPELDEMRIMKWMRIPQ